ncbi:DNA-binding domain-containing protein [Aspergillus affinis]|uniref:DNA-binding domain-containing protein n=1 Tax=Aspergillus affinis TaxID=1070780 RepID=UPI0022FE9A8A|nr:uncharacterized protein KD926_009524 [Aspergillus affinis]KAI9039381.1 hypothetical protein KD926_009524 [Aspergillus affinis]
MASNYYEIESRISRALEALSHQEKPNISKTARLFDVPRLRLRNRFLGRDSRITRLPGNLKLTEAQNSALIQYIECWAKVGLPPRPKMVRTAADSILKEAHDDPNTLPPTVGDKWLSRWLIRHPQYNMKKARAIEVERRRTHNRDDLEDWYRRLQSVIAVHGILDNDIWNFDETGFQIGIGKDQWIITRDHTKTYLGLNSNREYVTVVEAISAAGDLCPPFIIMPEIRPSTPSSTTSSEAGSSVLSTPKNIQRLAKFATNLGYDAVQDGYGFTRRLSKFIKGSIAQGWLAAGLQRQLDEMTRVQREKAERDRASKRRAPVGGVVSSTSLAHIERKEEELDTLKERTRLRAKWKQVMVELVDYAIDRGIIIKRQRKSRNKEETSSFPTV